MSKLEWLNNLSPEQVRTELQKCCGSINWVEKMMEKMPFKNESDLYKNAEQIWFNLSNRDWLEAFSHHPKIGDPDSIAKKFANTKHWAENEQSGVSSASRELLEELAKDNINYEEKYGYIFIVCATGKSAPEMINIIKERLKNEPETEINIAASEQNKITLLRLEKLINQDTNAGG